MLNIACVLSDGPKYNPTHVERLMRQVEGNLSEPYRFVCLTNSDVPCERVSLTEGWPGWWSKIELFTPNLFRDRVLYLDLDVTIVGSLDEVVQFPHEFAAIRNFTKRTSRLNSSAMVWDAGVGDAIYEEFKPSVMDEFHGDQGWISSMMPNAAVFQMGWFVSYRGRVQGRNVPSSAKVIVYHGFPKPWEVEVA